MKRRRKIALWQTLWLLPAAAAGQPAGSPPLRTAHLTVLSSASVMRSVNRNEGIAAGKVWLDSIARRRGFKLLESRFDVADTTEELHRRIAESSVGVVILDVIEYLCLPRPELLDPILMTVSGDRPRGYVLVVSGSGGGPAIQDLRGKRVSYLTKTNVDLARKWLDVTLHDRNMGRTDRFFESLAPALKPSAACLPVFFGKLDGCVIDEPGYDLLKELNPQFAVRTRVVATSPAYPEYFIGVHVNHREFREELIRGLLELNQDPEGRQLLMVFKGDRIMPAPPHQLDAVRGLWTKYRKLPETRESTAAHPAGGLP